MAGNNGQNKLPASNIPLIQQGFKKRCYICEREITVAPALKDAAILTCPLCEGQKNLFVLNLFKQSRVALQTIQAEKERQEKEKTEEQKEK